MWTGFAFGFFRTVVLEKTFESPLDRKDIKQVNPKGNQPWIFIGRPDAEAEAPILWPSDSFEKTLMLGKTEGRRRRGWQRTRWLDGITTQQIWVWANSRRQRRMGKPGVLQSRGLQRFGYNLATEQQQQPFYALKNSSDYILSKFDFNVSVQIPSPLYSKQRYYFANKGPSSQGYGFSSCHVWMWELDCEESWALKNWCFWTVVL